MTFINGISSPKGNGWTLIETIIVMGILMTFLGLVWINLGRIVPRANLDATVQNVVSDLKLQQIKAVSCETSASDCDSRGIRFETDRYILFRGISFNLADPTNEENLLETGLSFSTIRFPNQSVVFSPGSGEVPGYITGSDSVILSESRTADETTLQVNQFGAVTIN